NVPASVLFHTCDVTRSNNNSYNYAQAVGHLADRILGTGPFVQSWPSGEVALTRSQRQELQSLLNQRGFNAGTPDGVIGPLTRSALMQYQMSAGLVPDGHASGTIRSRLR